MKSSKTIQSAILSQKSNGRIKAERGVLYLIWGENDKVEKSLQRSIVSLKKYHPNIPIHVERFETAGKINKTKICNLSLFEQTVYLDNDTVILGRLDFGFEKAQQFGLACTLSGCPWARRYGDSRLSRDMIEYSSGVLFFTSEIHHVFDTWAKLFPKVDSSIIHYRNGEKCLMPEADQASFALAIEKTGFHPYVLPHNWNFHPQWNRFFFGPIKIWHGYYDVPQTLLDWNANQSAEDAILQSATVNMTLKDISTAPLAI